MMNRLAFTIALLLCSLAIPLARAQEKSPVSSSHPRYVLDWFHHRILQMEDADGKGLKELGVEGPGVGQFRHPRGLFVDTLQRIYVADTENHRLVRMDDITGKGWTTLGRPGKGKREFMCPASLIVEPNGRITVLDLYNNRIVQMDDMTGRNWKTLAIPDVWDRNKKRPVEKRVRLDDLKVPNVVVDGQGRLYYASRPTYCVVRIDDIAGHHRTTLGTPGKQASQFEENGFYPPVRVELDTTGRIYMQDVPGGIVRVDDMTGKNWTRIYAAVPGARSFSVVGTDTVYIASWGPLDAMIERLETRDGKATYTTVQRPWIAASGGMPIQVFAP